MTTRNARRRRIVALVASVAVAACTKKTAAPTPQAPDVIIAPVEIRDMPIEVEVTGQVRGGQDVEIRARVSGFLQSAPYREGSIVNRGDLLFTIDPRPFEANVARARAELAEAQARHDRAVVQVNRLRPLVALHAVAQQDLDNALAVEEAGRADIASAQAELTTAQLDLGYTRIRSPISGLAGNRLVDVGTYVGSPEPTVLAVVSQLDPIRFDFDIAETSYLTLVKTARAEGRSLLEFASRHELTLAHGSEHPYAGRLTVVGRGVSTETGTLPMQATFPNPAGLLRPGQFGRVKLRVATRHDAILVPQRAVQEVQGTYNVFVVGKDNIAGIREIKVADRVGSDWIVTSGLQPADKIVIEGLQKVADRKAVRPTIERAAAGSRKR
jgi:membrane fusion protein (multidrug efflux system)